MYASGYATGFIGGGSAIALGMILGRFGGLGIKMALKDKKYDVATFFGLGALAGAGFIALGGTILWRSIKKASNRVACLEFPCYEQHFSPEIAPQALLNEVLTRDDERIRDQYGVCWTPAWTSMRGTITTRLR